MNEIEALRTHSLKRIRRIYFCDKVLDVIAWISLLGILAAGCYWMVNL